MSEAIPSFDIIRSERRKRLAIRILEGKVQILMPMRFSENVARKFLEENRRWVQKKLQEYSNKTPYHARRYVDGESLLYLGKEYALNIAFSNISKTMIRDEQIFVFIRQTHCPQKRKKQIYEQLRFWYWQQANDILQQKTISYAHILNVQHKSVSIRQFKSRWGSCSTKGDIQYNWQIIMAPEPVIDYLVIHELAHIKHHNHSPRFWSIVKSIMPNHKEHKHWLKINGHLLRIE